MCLLAPEGVHTKKHQAARAKFSESFVKTGWFDMQANKIAANNLAVRQAADYDMNAFLNDVEAQLLPDDAQTFHVLTLAYFAQNPVT